MVSSLASRLLVVVVSLTFSVPSGLAAQKLPQDSASRAGRCDFRLITCDSGCDKLIDIGNAVSDCKKQCDDRHRRCMRWAAEGSKPQPK
jgi:hypothetical protein